jgi:TPR repeat protein
VAAPPPPASPAPSPAPAVATAPPRRPPADPALLAGLLRRGDALLALGDVSGARRFYERAAEAGSAAGARAAGRTHDPAVLAGLGARGIRPDPEAAAEWYRRADTLAAQERP